MWNVLPMAIASFMALIDTIVFSSLKEYTLGTFTWQGVIPLSMILYSFQPYIFLKSLKYETMTVMNIMWDVISDIFVTIVGLFYFKETLSPLKMTGLAFAFIAIVLLSYDELQSIP